MALFSDPVTLSWPLKDELILVHAVLAHDFTATFGISIQLELSTSSFLPLHCCLVQHKLRTLLISTVTMQREKGIPFLAS